MLNLDATFDQREEVICLLNIK